MSTMTPATLERVLSYLPNPSCATVSLAGDFDHAAACRQAEAVVPGIKLQGWEREARYLLVKPTNDHILAIYTRAHQMEPMLLRDDDAAWQKQRVQLEEVLWRLEDRAEVKLTFGELSVSYEGKEPETIARMRAELSPKLKFPTEVMVKFNLEECGPAIN